MNTDGPPASGSMPAAASTPSLVGQTLDGRYRITKKLGEGGMGEVYAAEHIHIEKRFAIKLLKAEIVSNAEAVTRFRQEARSSSSIGHRNIIAIEDFGQLQDGRIYMCMELLNGAALNDLIANPLPADRLLNIMIQTGHGLAAAHAKGIVHRDMKPENIFVTIAPNGEDVPKLLDFGIAKVAGNDGQNNLTRTGTIFGTPFYMAPEQALGNPVDARTDIYAMGVIMYECFAGSLPFQGESFMGILTQHITTEPEPVAQRAAKAGRHLPPGIADIITRCMQKNPAQRFATMDELVNALIGVYRGVAGPGMSTYMEAFPVGSAQHMAQPTPGPMTRPVQVGGAHAATMAAGPPPTGAHMPVGPSGAYAPAGQSQPYMPHQTPGSGMYAASSSVAVPKKSSMGLILAIFAVLAVGGGIAAFVLLSKKDDKAGAGSGSDVVATGSDTGSSVVPTTGSDTGSSVIPNNGSDNGSNVAGNGSDTGSGAGSDLATNGSNAGSDTGSATTPPVDTIPVVLATNSLSFEIWEDGNKLEDGPTSVQIERGKPRTFVLKAKGYKDQTIKVDGKKKTVTTLLKKLPGQNTGNNTGSNSSHNPPPKLDCSSTIKDPKDRACRKQYCDSHPDDVRCDTE